MAIDAFNSFGESLTAPLTGIETVTPSDTADLNYICRAILVGTTGDVAITMKDGSTGVLFLLAGVPYPIRVSRVFSTGTTATNIVALN